MKELKKYDPLFADVTWGAGGSTSDLTVELCVRAKTEVGMNPNMHLTCTNMEKEKIDRALVTCRENGIRNILALRGNNTCLWGRSIPLRVDFDCISVCGIRR